jgi:hypothetical protein
MISHESVLDFAKIFWGRVDQRDGNECWPWLGGTTDDGYGIISVGKRKLGAHVVSLMLSRGLTSKVVRHTCDNPICVRPSHLIGGTQYQNILDRVRRDRGARGARNGRALINDTIATEMVAQLARGMSCAKVAASHGVSAALVAEIRIGHNWRHIPRPKNLPQPVATICRRNPRKPKPRKMPSYVAVVADPTTLK